MADFNLNGMLNGMSLKELKKLQSKVVHAISSFEYRRRKQALSELEDKARSMGFSLAELTGTSAPRHLGTSAPRHLGPQSTIFDSIPRKRAPAVAKYANPENLSEKWSGRGRKPRWFDAALKSGKRPEDMLF